MRSVLGLLTAVRNKDLSEEVNQRDYLEAALSFYNKETHKFLSTPLEQLKGDTENMYLGFEAGLMNLKGNLVQNTESLTASMNSLSKTFEKIPQNFVKVC